MHLHRLLSKCHQLVPVELSGPRVVFDLGVAAGAVVGAEELSSVRIPTQLHLPQLQPGPVGVQVGAPHKGQVHAEIAMHSGAVDAYKNAVRDR